MWLVNKSLVTVESHPTGERRYRLLDTVRQYAGERLMESCAVDRLRDKHFALFFNDYRGALPILRGPDQLRCLKLLQVERDNLRSALEWSFMSPFLAENGLELAGASFWYWTKRGDFAEGRQWLERARDATLRCVDASALAL